MYTKNEAVVHKDNKPDYSRKKQVTKPVQIMKVGDSAKCPECRAVGLVVWVSQDKKKMGVRCFASHRAIYRVWSKNGEINVPSDKARTNVVFLTPMG